ncbi:unnamed protein product, partial [Prorocentrum cordatum]
ETFDLARCTGAASLFDALAFTAEGLHPVRLVRTSWLLQQRGTAPKGRQELLEKAIVSAEELRAVWEAGGRGGKDQVAPIITISFCWDSREHPDPKGLQLNLVADTLEKERRNYSTANGDLKWFSEMGVFRDWPSLPQGEPVKDKEAKAAALRQGKSEEGAQETADKAKRTPAEKAVFRHGLEETMDPWYAHEATTVLLLTQHPCERGSTRECGCATGTRGERGLRVALGLFPGLIEDRSFTSDADQAVRALFRRWSRAQLGGVTELDFVGVPPTAPEQSARLSGCLQPCARREELGLQSCQIGLAGAKALAEALPSMTSLKTLVLDSSSIGDEGAQALAGALPSVPGLKKLCPNGNSIPKKGRE